MASKTESIHHVMDLACGGPEVQAPLLRALLAAGDFTSISYYAFIRMHRDSGGFHAAFDAMRAISPGTLVVSNTGEIAARLFQGTLNVTLLGSPEMQARHISTPLAEAQGQKFEFVTHWTHRDDVEFLGMFPPELRVIGGVWLRIGLLAADDAGRPAFQVWRSWLNWRRFAPGPVARHAGTFQKDRTRGIGFMRIAAAALFALVFATLASAHGVPEPEAPARPEKPTATGEPSSMVDAFHMGLGTGDRNAVLALLGGQVQIYEQGWIERAKSE